MPKTIRTRRKRPAPPFPPQHQPRPGIESKMTPRPEYWGTTYRPAAKLGGKVALITGGDSGIGRSVAVLFAREGADVAIVFLPSERSDANETAQVVAQQGRRCILLPGDVSRPQFCARAVRETVAQLGRLDILVNNAAYQHHQKRLEDVSQQQLERTFGTNVFGCFHMVQAALPHLEPGSVIINTGSITGLEGRPGIVDYSATKGAIHALTKALAQDLLPRGIRVNCVAPGPVWTPLNVADKPAHEAAVHGESTAMGRPAQPEEIAPAYVFFASSGDSSYITGEVLTLLGGETRAG